MIFNIEVNNKSIKAKKGETILSALRRNGIDVPTLCHMSDLNATGACRICVVELEGRSNLVTSCSQPVEEWMKIFTHSPRVIQARKTLVELLLANHPDDCLYCPRNGKCELQHLAGELNVRERRFPNQKAFHRIDQSCDALVRDPAKCILCSRCVRTCEEIIGVSALDFIRRGEKTAIGTTFEKPVNLSSCINCGQCIMKCPTAALREKEQFALVQEVLHKPGIYPVVQYSPALTVSVAEEFGLKAGRDLQGLLNSVLRKIGFKRVFDTSFAADILVLELVAELNERVKREEKLPLVSSCCPAWVKYAEQNLQQYLPLLAPLKSPEQIAAHLVKAYAAGLYNIAADTLHLTSIAPCTARKVEAKREKMNIGDVQEIDTVLTTRELINLIRLNGIDLNLLDEEIADNPLATRSSAAKLMSISGGLTEAIIRTFYFNENMQDMDNCKISKLRSGKEKKEISVGFNGKELNFVVVSTIKQVRQLIAEAENGKKKIDFIEVMVCPGGCINGGGQPFSHGDDVCQSRIKTIYDIDDKESIRASYKNPGIIELYRNILGSPGSEKSKEWFSAEFNKRSVL
jgi:iron-only hydrogenase group A